MSYFKETQKMTQWWLWLILIGVNGIWLWAIVQQVILQQPFGDKPSSNSELLLTALFPIALLLLFYVLVLKTDITDKGIYIKYFPLWRTQLPWDEISDVQIIKYTPFIGYGIRISVDYGTVYNAKGNMGLLIRKKNGKKVLIGTQQPNELQQVIHTYFPDKEHRHN